MKQPLRSLRPLPPDGALSGFGRPGATAMEAAPCTVPGRLRDRALRTGDTVAFLHRAGEDGWQSITWHDLLAQVRRLASHFARLGIRRGDRIVIMLPTGPDWELCQQAALTIGAVVVGLDSHDAPQNLQRALALTQPRLIVTSDEEPLDLIRGIWRLPEIAVVATAGAARSAAVHALDGLLAADPGSGVPAIPEPGPDDPATIVFTSGSTGHPKGIAYSHRQLCLAVDGLMERFPSVRQDARMICWLPLSTLFQRVINLLAISCGATSYFLDVPDVMRFAPEIRPTLFVGVPRFFEKLHGGIQAGLENRSTAERTIVHAAWAIGSRRAAALRAGKRPPLWCRLLFPAADRVLARVRALMGPDLQFMASGSAPMPRWLLERLHGLGWTVLEAYGTSENVMPIAFNTLRQFRFGSVGKPLPGNELRFADDGELLVRGPGVFGGYYGESASSDTIDAEGFLHTGDYAHLDHDGFLWLDGRKSEVFKTSTGRRVPPAPIEAALKTLDYVDHAVVVGRDRPYPIALLTIAPQHPFAAKLSDPATHTAVAADALDACRAFPEFQRPGAIIVSPRALSVSGGELTLNQKIRRIPIEQRFRAQIDEAYRRSTQAHRGQPCPTLPVIEAP
ncbi:AMP-dependent synthetase/ligase [Thauera sinica]|uniref:AMP-dependent synthetase/ligase n=1 Tax=Thauera sinica TaxID=2665146 RepID=A0ABW1AKX2_9RHOO|nr:AMP-binding protein [Thauera sp. K11]